MTDSEKWDPAKIKRVLVTGASGILAKWVIPELEANYELRLTDLAPRGNDDRFVAADLTDFESVYRLIEGMDAVVHLAVATGDGRGEPMPDNKIDPVDDRTLRVNTTSSFYLLEAALRHKIKRVVYASSFTILLANRHRPRYDGKTELEPTNLYACTKLFGEQLAGTYWRNHGLSTICLRIGQPTPIGHMFDELWRTNKRSRCWATHVEDVAQAMGCALRTPVSHGIFPLVSASDNPRIAWEETRDAMGYVPRAYFSDQGLSFHPDGNHPSHDGSIVTHNPEEL